MADITMCDGVKKADGEFHDLCEVCYRRTAWANPYQSYFLIPPLGGDECSKFIEPRRTSSAASGN